MTRLFALAAAALMTMPVAAQDADPAGQRLGQCMVMKSTGADRLQVARWLLGVLASSPQTADVASVTTAKKEAVDRDMATVFTRLLVKDCAAESRMIFAKENGRGEGFRIGGEALGKVAMAELLNNPRAQEAIGSYVKYLKIEEFKDVLPPK